MVIWHVVDHELIMAISLCFVLWIFDILIMITFFLFICGYWTWFWTNECILTIFRQVIFVNICGYLCVNSFETCGSVLVICACASNVFLEIYLLVPLVRFWVSEWLYMRVGWGLLTCTHSSCKGFCSRIAKEGDCECLARLTILEKIPKCPLTQFTNPSSDYLT